MTDDHRLFEELLPWYLNGTLEGDERIALEDHLTGCASCVQELDELEEIRVQVRLAGSAPSDPVTAGPSIEALWQSIGETERSPSSLISPRALRWLVAGQAAAILALVSLLVAPGPGPGGQAVASSAAADGTTFRTLSSPEPLPRASGRMRLVLHQEVSELEMRELLLSLGLEIVGGPNEVGAYLVAWSREGASPEVDDPLRRLRGDPRVLMAEPVGGLPPTSAPP